VFCNWWVIHPGYFSATQIQSDPQTYKSDARTVLTTMDFDDSIPLPVGTMLPQNTVLANPILQVHGEHIEVHDETDSGWPTIVTFETSCHPAGLAVDYLGAWHSGDTGMEEVDLILSYEDGEWTWRAIVAYSTKRGAVDRGRYETDEYDGHEFVPWHTDNLFESMEELLDDNVTPIAYTEGKPTYAAQAMQEADNIHTLNRMFGIGELQTLTRRREQLFKRVVPREVRWKDKENPLQNLAKKVLDDSPQPADEPYEVGDRVKIQFDSNSSDSHYHGMVGTVADVMQDELGGETEREVDAFSYKVELEDEEVESWFRHQNLVPAE